MNVAATARKKSFSLDPFISRILPAEGVGQTIIWSALPLLLLLLVVGVSFLSICAVTQYIPFLALGSTIAILRFRTVGLSFSYGILVLFLSYFFSDLHDNERLWQMGIIFSLAISLYIFLLSVEEIEACWTDIGRQARDLKALSVQAELNITCAKKTAEEKEKEFQAEIERLKQEAELRCIEKEQLTIQFVLLRNEIELLTSQKDEFIHETRLARELAASSLTQLKEAEKSFEVKYQCLQESLNETITLLETQNQQLVQTTEDAKAQAENSLEKLRIMQVEHNKECLSLKESLHSTIVALQSKQKQDELTIQEAHKKITILTAQLQQTEIKLDNEQKALQEALAAKNRILEENEILFVEAQNVEKKASQYLLELEAVKKTYGETIHALKNSILENQETILHLQLKEQAISNPQPEEITELKRSHAHIEGLYNQLRTQFKEKSLILSQTRQELFHTQGKLFALEKESARIAMDPHEETLSLQRVLDKEMRTFTEEIKMLEKEINDLEELISHILSQ